ncbi:MAG: MATE family efflux transporter [Treponema sp.]|nr:MATE family efflux transporter [Treponema sp.]
MAYSRSSNKIDMTDGPIFIKLLQFSIPLILSSVLQLLFNAADVIVVGRFAGDNSLAAVGSTGSLINLLVNLFMGLSVGTNVVAANFFGSGNRTALRKTVQTAMILSVYSGVILTIAGVFGAKSILHLMQSPEEVLNLSALYLKIYFAGMTATMIYNFGSALLRAKGDTKRPLYILFVAGVINVILNLIFVIIFKMDVAGVATATVISQCFSAFMIVRCLIKESDDFKLDLKNLIFDKSIFIKIIQIGLPAGFQGIMFSLSNVIIQSSINSFGNIVIAGNSASSNLEGFVYTSMNGFAQGVLTFVSQNYGAKKYPRIKKVVIVAELTVIVVGLVLGNAMYFFGNQLLKMYTENPEVIKAGLIRLSIIGTTYFLCGMMDVMGNSIRGMGHSLLPMIFSLLGACAFRLIWLATVFVIPKYHSLFIVIMSYPLSWILTFACHIVCFAILYNWHKKGKLI